MYCQRSRGILFLVLVILFIGQWVVAATPDLVLLHLNDCHGQLLCNGASKGLPGGYPRIATLVRSIRTEQPDRVLLLHAGDVMSRGDALTVDTFGKANCEVFKALGLDALTPGNGDFYWGLDRLLAWRAVAPFPVLHANIRLRDRDEQLFAPDTVINRNGIRVGILGLGVVRMEHYSARGLILDDARDVAARRIPDLRRRSDLVVVLSHLGLDDDRRLAQSVNGIDVIVGGHSHSILQEAEPQRSPNGSRTALLVQAGDYGQYLGRLDLSLERAADGAWRVGKYTHQLIPVTKEIPEDPQVLAVLEPYRARTREVVFHLDDALSSRSLGWAVAEAIRRAAKADVALIEPGAITGGLGPGAVTRGDLLMVHQFRNQIMLAQVDAARLVPLLASTDLIHATPGTARAMNAVVADAWQPVPGQVYKVAVGGYALNTIPAMSHWETSDTQLDVTQVILDQMGGILAPTRLSSGQRPVAVH